MGTRIVGEEYDGNRLVRSWFLDQKAGAVESLGEDASNESSVLLWFKKGFLPDGYPDAVTSDYVGAFSQANKPP